MNVKLKRDESFGYPVWTVFEDGVDIGRIEELICGFSAFPHSLKYPHSIGDFDTKEDATEAILKLSPTR
jgi:hypothetical protein